MELLVFIHELESAGCTESVAETYFQWGRCASIQKPISWILMGSLLSSCLPEADNCSTIFSAQAGKEQYIWDGKSTWYFWKQWVLFIHIYYEKFQLSLGTLQVTNLAVICWVCRCNIVSLQKWSGVTWQYDTSAFQIKMALSIIIWLISLLPLQQDRIQLLLQFWLSN